MSGERNGELLVLGPDGAGRGGASVPFPRMKAGAWLSLLVHGLALALLTQLQALPAGLDGGPAVVPAVVMVELVAPPAPEPPPPEAVQPEPPKPEPPKPEPKPEPVKVEQAKPMPLPAAARLPKPAVRPEASAPAVGMAVTEMPAAEPAPSAPLAAPAPGVTGATPAEDVMADYARHLWEQISRHKPGHVRFQGTVTLSFSLSPSGDLRSSGIAVSSGIGRLDAIALQALSEAAPFPPLPHGASAEQLTFSIPFTFQ